MPRENIDVVVCVDTAFLVENNKTSKLGVLIILSD